MDVEGKLESSNDLKLAEYFASLGDIFVNDAFGSMHRAHASTAGIAKFLPSVKTAFFNESFHYFVNMSH